MSMFVVHEHHASRIHFDLRIESGGMLKTFALPKGPSMNPLEKRLAIEVADHPVSYGSFEGIIPAGDYGAGIVVIWDRGTVMIRKGSFEKGSIEADFQGSILRGIFILKKMDKGERHWLFFKKKDGLEDYGFTLYSALTEKKRTELKALAPACQTH